MIQKVLSFVRQHHMISQGEHIAAGVSGGADSVCLLLMLNAWKEELNLQLTVLHVEHGIRGEDSLRDAAFVKELCEKMDISCRIHHCRAEEYAKSRGMSLEEGARELRYRYFERTAMELGADKIAIAHNQNDCAETLLFHLARGTGLKGMCGIPPVRGNKIRPLLCLNRLEIEAYLDALGQQYCTDQTNLGTEYSRNKIRHQVLPVLEEINEKSVNHLYQSTLLISESLEVINQLADQAAERYVQDSFLSEEIKKEPLLIQKTLIHRLISRCAGSSRDIAGIHITQVLSLFAKQTGREVTLPYGLGALRTYGGILIQREKENRQEKADGGIVQWEAALNPGDFSAVPGTDWIISARLLGKDEQKREIPKKKYTKWLDYDKINGNLLLRTRRPGDYFILDTQGRKQRLKDYFINEKIPADERDHILLLAEGSHILWVIGYRISESCKVMEGTRRILEIQVNGGKTHE